jgi:hypothetical protein
MLKRPENIGQAKMRKRRARLFYLYEVESDEDAEEEAVDQSESDIEDCIIVDVK